MTTAVDSVYHDNGLTSKYSHYHYVLWTWSIYEYVFATFLIHLLFANIYICLCVHLGFPISVAHHFTTSISIIGVVVLQYFSGICVNDKISTMVIRSIPPLRLLHKTRIYDFASYLYWMLRSENINDNNNK